MTIYFNKLMLGIHIIKYDSSSFYLVDKTKIGYSYIYPISYLRNKKYLTGSFRNHSTLEVTKKYKLYEV